MPYKRKTYYIKDKLTWERVMEIRVQEEKKGTIKLVKGSPGWCGSVD